MFYTKKLSNVRFFPPVMRWKHLNISMSCAVVTLLELAEAKSPIDWIIRSFENQYHVPNFSRINISMFMIPEMLQKDVLFKKIFKFILINIYLYPPKYNWLDDYNTSFSVVFINVTSTLGHQDSAFRDINYN